MAFKTHINNSTGNQAGQVSTSLTAAYSEGVHNLIGGHLKVTGTAGMAVSVAAGDAFVYNDNYVIGTMDQALFSVSSSASESVTITSNSSGNPRVDIVCLKVDTAATPGTQGSGSSSLVAIAGTPAVSPVAPAVPSNHLLLAEISVANGATLISNANITDKRVQATTAMVTGQEGFLINGQITRTVASNNITVAVKTLAGNDPSVQEPVWVRIGNNLHKLTAALSVTANAGTNRFNAGSAELATNEIDYFVYLGYNATDGVTIGFSRIPYARQYSDFNTTTTNEKYCAISTITNAAAADPYVVIGRINATLSAGASYNWSVPATSVIINRPIFETRLLNYTTTFTASGSMTITLQPTVRFAKYKLQESLCHLHLYADTFTLGGTASNQVFSSSPFSIGSGYGYNIHSGGMIVDASAALAVQIAITFMIGNTFGFSRYDNANWTLASGKSARGEITFDLT